MKENDGKRYDLDGKELAFLKGKVEGLQEAMEKMKGKTKSIASGFWYNFTHNLAKYFAGLFFAGLLIYGSVWYISKKTDEVVTSVKTEIAEAVDIHPIENTKKWFSNGNHWWSESNETIIENNETIVESVDENISQDENKTSFLTKAKSWFSWGKEKNTTKE